LTPALQPAEPPVKDPGEQQIAAWWADLAGTEARPAYAAIWKLAAVPEGVVVAFLRRHLKPAADADFERARQLIKDLGSDTSEVREKALAGLQALGNGAAPALRQALEKDPPPEVRHRLEEVLSRPESLVPSPESVRRVRAIQVLERIGSKEARRLLADLAAGASHAAETQEARAALERLSR
jgi:hypothetical protein